MPVKSFCARFVIIGSHHEHGISPDGVGLLGKFDRFLCGVGAGARNDGYSPPRHLHGGLNNFNVFLVVYRR